MRVGFRPVYFTSLPIFLYLENQLNWFISIDTYLAYIDTCNHVCIDICHTYIDRYKDTYMHTIHPYIHTYTHFFEKFHLCHFHLHIHALSYCKLSKSPYSGSWDIGLHKFDVCHFCLLVVPCYTAMFQANSCMGSWNVRLHRFGANQVLIAHLAHKGNLGENSIYIFLMMYVAIRTHHHGKLKSSRNASLDTGTTDIPT